MERKFSKSPSRRESHLTEKYQETKILPENWEVRISKTIDPGQPYYFNLTTKESQWDFPSQIDLTQIKKQIKEIRESTLSDDEKQDLIVQLVTDFALHKKSSVDRVVTPNEITVRRLPQPQVKPPRFPKSNVPVSNNSCPTYLKNITEQDMYNSSNEHFKKQILQIDLDFNKHLGDPYIDLQREIFFAFYSLSKAKYINTHIELEMEQVNTLVNILKERKDLTLVQKQSILFNFAMTLNNDNSYKYCKSFTSASNANRLLSENY